MNANLNLAIGLLASPNQKNLLSKFILKLNATELNNFTKNTTNKNAFIRQWIRAKTGYTNNEIQSLMKPVNTKTSLERYANALFNAMNNNMRIIEHLKPKDPPPYINLQLKAPKEPLKGYIQLEPVCKNNQSKGFYIHYGTTFNKYRGQGIGYRLRKVAANAARKIKMPLYQVSQNIEGLVKKGNLPVSGKIMMKLGAHRLNHPPPCRSENVRGPQNFSFVIGNKPLKRPIPRGNVTKKRTLKARRN
jgi:hypothetical protein